MENRAEASEWDVLRVLNWGTQHFKQRGVHQPKLSIEWILCDALQVKRFDLYLQFDRPLTGPELKVVRSGVERRLKGEPLQYITGFTDFHHCRISLSRDVLIPRPETEELVTLILQNETDLKLSAVDACTGSGCIAVALKHARPGWSMFAFDVSEPALAVARQNAAANETPVTFFKLDVKQAAKRVPQQPVDVLISNPPYVTGDEKPAMDRWVVDWEPHTALFCEHPLEFYDALCAAARVWLKPGGRVYLELNDTHASAVRNLFGTSGFTAQLHTDMNNRTRFLSAVKNAEDFDKLAEHR